MITEEVLPDGTFLSLFVPKKNFLFFPYPCPAGGRMHRRGWSNKPEPPDNDQPEQHQYPGNHPYRNPVRDCYVQGAVRVHAAVRCGDNVGS